LPQLFEIFKLQYPNIVIQMDTGNSHEVIERILSFKNDIGFIGIDYADKHLVKIPFIVERLVLIVPPDHELTQKRTISFKDLNGQKMIMREKGSGTMEIIERELLNHKVTIEPAMELGSNEAIKQAVEAGLGISIISSNVVKLDNDQGRIKILHFSNNRDIIRRFYIIYHKDKYLSDLLKIFLRVASDFSNRFPESL